MLILIDPATPANAEIRLHRKRLNIFCHQKIYISFKKQNNGTNMYRKNLDTVIFQELS